MKINLPIEILIKILQYARNKCSKCGKNIIIPYALFGVKYYCCKKCFPFSPSSTRLSEYMYVVFSKKNDDGTFFEMNS